MIHAFRNLFRRDRLTAIEDRLAAIEAQAIAGARGLDHLAAAAADASAAAMAARHDADAIDEWAEDVDIEIAALRATLARLDRERPTARVARLRARLVAAAHKLRSTLI